MANEHVSVVVIGAGFGGIGLGAQLRRRGITDFVILERTDDLGGTWSRNTYPGAACDVPSALYCFAFAPNPQWSRKYGTQAEILEYLRKVADDHGVTPHIRLGVTVLGAAFDEARHVWNIETDQGPLTADAVVSAVGAFAEAAVPDIPGMDAYRGRIVHTLHWDHDLDLTDRRVAVIGTGATAVQLIPELQPVAAHVAVFQRTPPWIVPRNDRETADRERRLFARIPATQQAVRSYWYAGIESFGLPGFVHRAFRHPFELLARRHLRHQVSDPELRKRLTPDYMIGCKRAIFSDAFYPAMSAPNVTLVTDPIAGINTTGIVTAGGAHHEVDVIVLATGFTPIPRLTEEIRGTHGRSIAEIYRERPQSYLGVANSRFPNMFTILGPFGAAGNQSAVVMIEAQIGYIVDALVRVRAAELSRYEVRASEQERFVEQAHQRAHRGTWLSGGCSSYYTNGAGLNSGLYPGWSFEYRHRLRRWNPEAYDIIGTTGEPA